MSDFNWDQSAANAESNDWQQASTEMWDTSIDFRHIGDEYWIQGETELANQMYQAQYQFEDMSNQAYEAAWDAYNGPLNAEGYTMHDASLGYTSTDTSFIEPASSAGSCSMISTNSGESFL